MYKAAGWTRLGRTKGYARANGRFTDPHGVPKDLHVFRCTAIPEVVCVPQIVFVDRQTFWSQSPHSFSESIRVYPERDRLRIKEIVATQLPQRRSTRPESPAKKFSFLSVTCQPMCRASNERPGCWSKARWILRPMVGIQ